MRPSIPTTVSTRRDNPPRGTVRRGISTSIGPIGIAIWAAGRATWVDCHSHSRTTTTTTTTIRGRRARPSPSTTTTSRLTRRRVPRGAFPTPHPRPDDRRRDVRRIDHPTEVPAICIAPRSTRFRTTTTTTTTTTAPLAGDVRPSGWIPCTGTFASADGGGGGGGGGSADDGRHRGGGGARYGGGRGVVREEEVTG